LLHPNMFLSLYDLRVLDSGVIFSTGERVSLLGSWNRT
jgi:hypothetical protein